MKTTRKQLINFAIGLVKEVSKNNSNNSNVTVEYSNSGVNVWFFYKEKECERLHLFEHYCLKENKAKFRKAILKIRGIML